MLHAQVKEQEEGEATTRRNAKKDRMAHSLTAGRLPHSFTSELLRGCLQETELLVAQLQQAGSPRMQATRSRRSGC